MNVSKLRLLSILMALPLAACGSGALEGPGMVAGEDEDDDDIGGGPDASVVPDQPDADLGIPQGRVLRGLQVLYTFTGSPGATTIRDLSEVGEPYDLTIQDPAAVEWADGGLVFTEPTIATNELPATKIIEACGPANAITMEAWVRPDVLEPAADARVMSLSIDTTSRNFDMIQKANQDYWTFRLRTNETNDNGSNPRTDAPSGSVTGEMQHVVYVREGLTGSANSYLDGVKQVPQTIPGVTNNWDLEYSLHVGNEQTLDRPFLGQINLVAVYCRALTGTEVRQNYEAGY